MIKTIGGTEVEIIDLLPPFKSNGKEIPQVRIRNVDPNSCTQGNEIDINLCYLLDSRPGEIEERIGERIGQNMRVNLGGKVEFLGYSLIAGEGGERGVGFFFRCVEGMEEDYTLWVHGEVEDEALLEGQRREGGYGVFDHLLPTSRWEVGEVYEDDGVRGLKGGRYHLSLGLWRPEDGSRLWREDDAEAHIIDLGWIEVK